ncbi:glycoside hydrolase [Xylogone sp. PMI_703]|nr:glycoside hydrolase [Xylogone sp. PMI_703]
MRAALLSFYSISIFSCVFYTALALPTSSRRATAAISGQAAQYAGWSRAAIEELQTMYNETTGLWDNDWWNSANVITMLADTQERFPSYVQDITAKVFPNTLAKAPLFGFANFINGFYDDELWWVLAWIKVYDVTKESVYLDTAAAIFEDAKAAWGTTPCSGLWWDKEHTSVAAISNSLYLTAAAKLANRRPSTPAPYYYLSEAIRSYNWIVNSGLINSDNVINDGLHLDTCKNNGFPVFTYNQGAPLAGMVELSWATGDAKYNEQANTIATAAISKLTDSSGILHEPCEPNACDGDEGQFKGVLARNIQFLYNRGASLSDETKTQFKAFLQTNANAIWANKGPNNQFGLVWSGPYQTADVQTQSSALDCVIGAAAVS